MSELAKGWVSGGDSGILPTIELTGMDSTTGPINVNLNQEAAVIYTTKAGQRIETGLVFAGNFSEFRDVCMLLISPTGTSAGGRVYVVRVGDTLRVVDPSNPQTSLDIYFYLNASGYIYAKITRIHGTGSTEPGWISFGNLIILAKK